MMKKMKKIFKVLFIEQTENTRIQFLRYIFVGGISAVINIGTLYILKDIVNIYYLIANAIGFVLGLITNYFLSKMLVFTKENMSNPTIEFIIYALIGLIGLGIDSLLMWILTSKLNIYYMISKIFSTMLVFVWNFGIRKVVYKLKNKVKRGICK